MENNDEGVDMTTSTIIMYALAITGIAFLILLALVVPTIITYVLKLF